MADLIARWSKRLAKKTTLSPIGITQEGRQDFRGVPAVGISLRSMKIIDGDFTSADFRHAKFEDCHFKNCVFDAASLADASIFRGSFYESRFRRTDVGLSFNPGL